MTDSTLAEHYRKAGFEIIVRETLRNSDWSKLETTWAKRLKENRHRSVVRIEVLEADRRPVSATADNVETRDVTAVEIKEDTAAALTLLFDPGHALDERIVREQFVV